MEEKGKIHFLLFFCSLCYSDIDECINGSHDCHQHAICVNAAGHFNCSCQAGFTGNGRLCQGNSSPRSIYSNSYMTPRLSGHFSTLGLVFFVLKALFTRREGNPGARVTLAKGLP